MRIKPDDNKIRSFTKLYWREGREVLAKTTAPVINLIGNVPIEEIKQRAELIMDSNATREYLLKIWTTTGGFFARDMADRLMMRQKDDQFWEDAYYAYMAERVKAKVAGIARTQSSLFNSVVDLVIREGEAEGLSIQNITSRLKYEVNKRMLEIQSWEAQRIAQTEVIGAANKGSFDGARATGLEIKKGWLTSGRSNVRDSHRLYESRGFVPMDFDYGTLMGIGGLMHPGDPNGAAEEIINCHCAIIYSTL